MQKCENYDVQCEKPKARAKVCLKYESAKIQLSTITGSKLLLNAQ